MFETISSHNGNTIMYSDPDTGFNCYLHIEKTHIIPEVMHGVYCYDVYLTDCCVFHDVQLRICHELLSESQYKTERKRRKVLQGIIENNLQEAVKRYNQIIISNYPPCDECPLHNQHDDC